MIRWPQRVTVVAVLGIVQSLAYLKLNGAPLRASRELPLLGLDRALPFLPWTVWPYFALLACQAAFPLLVRGRGEFRRLLTAYACALGATFAIQAAWPTRYPRPPLPDPDVVGATTYAWLASLDTPECCWPSTHVLVPLLAAWSLFRDRGWRWPFALTLALTPSVLTTKQHYTVDVLGAWLLAAIAIAVFGRERASTPGPPTPSA